MNGEYKSLTLHERWLPVLGIALLLLGAGAGAVIEKGQLAYHAAMKRHTGDVLDLSAHGHPDSSLQGRMVRVAGPLQVVEAPLDRQFNQQVGRPALIRHVQMFQWCELRYGGVPAYGQDWQNYPVDASRFQHPEGHANPGKFPLEGARFDANEVRMKDFVLAPALVRALPGREPIMPDLRRLPSQLAASFSLYDGALVTSPLPTQPRVGDLRVSWEAVPLQTVTIVARVEGNQLIPAADAADGIGFAVHAGDVPLSAIFPDAPLPPASPWLRRVLALLLAGLGAAWLLRWHYRRVDPLLVPAIAMLAVGATDAMVWLGHGNGTAAVWFAFALVGAALVFWRVRALRSAA